jgi:hypothetical protein
MPAVVQLGGTQLAAASCGARQTLWIEHYSAVLYLPRRAPAQEEMVDPLSPKLLEITIVDTRFLPRDIPRKWREPIERHLDADGRARAQAAYNGLVAGDRLTLAYAADQGVTFKLNGRLVAKSPGHSLVDDILATWADDEPMRKKLGRVIGRNACRADQLAAQ